MLNNIKQMDNKRLLGTLCVIVQDEHKRFCTKEWKKRPCLYESKLSIRRRLNSDLMCAVIKYR